MFFQAKYVRRLFCIVRVRASWSGLQFITTQPIRKNEQFCHWYGPDWWSARGLKRANVATEKYPAPLREPKSATSNRSGLKEMKKVLKGAIKKIEKKKRGNQTGKAAAAR